MKNALNHPLNTEKSLQYVRENLEQHERLMLLARSTCLCQFAQEMGYDTKPNIAKGYFTCYACER